MSSPGRPIMPREFMPLKFFFAGAAIGVVVAVALGPEQIVRLLAKM